MYRYAGWSLGTGAMPCRRASAHVMRPSPLSSQIARASTSCATSVRIGDNGAAGRADVTHGRTSIVVASQRDRTASAAAASARSMFSPYLRRTSRVRATNQQALISGVHPATSLPLLLYRLTPRLARVRFSRLTQTPPSPSEAPHTGRCRAPPRLPPCAQCPSRPCSGNLAVLIFVALASETRQIRGSTKVLKWHKGAFSGITYGKSAPSRLLPHRLKRDSVSAAYIALAITDDPLPDAAARATPLPARMGGAHGKTPTARPPRRRYPTTRRGARASTARYRTAGISGGRRAGNPAAAGPFASAIRRCCHRCRSLAPC